MNKVQQLAAHRGPDQQGRPWLAIPVATWKKFGDDQAGNLAALISYYAFASIFPLLLIFVTILDLVLSDNPAEVPSCRARRSASIRSSARTCSATVRAAPDRAGAGYRL